jgi:hypothetical protein
MHQRLGVNNLAAECLADTLVAETHTQQRNFAGEVLIVATEIPASFGVHGPGETTIYCGFSFSICSTVISSLRKTSTSVHQVLQNIAPGCR